MCVLCLVPQSCPTLCSPMDCCPPGSSVLCPGKNTGVGCHALLQGIFPTQGSNPGVPNRRKILYHLSQQGSDFTFTFHFHALEKEMATHSSVLSWRIPGMGEPGRLLSMGSHRVGHDWSDLAAAAAGWPWETLLLLWAQNKPETPQEGPSPRNP